MQDIALHLLDVLENSAKAGAENVRVDFTWSDTRLRLRIEDDGPGLPPDIAADPTDPYRTTRRERPVGLGLAFLRQSVEETGGSLVVASTPGKGVDVAAEFIFGSADAKPLGDLPGVLAMTTVAWPDLNLRVTVGGGDLVLDMKAVKAELDGIPLDHPAVRAFVGELLEGGLAELMAWGGQEFDLDQQAAEAQEGRADPAGPPAGGHTPPSVFP